MDEKTAAAVGAAAALAVAGRRLRPVAKLGMRGFVVVSDTVAGAVRGVNELYSEVREEQRKDSSTATDVPTNNAT